MTHVTPKRVPRLNPDKRVPAWQTIFCWQPLRFAHRGGRARYSSTVGKKRQAATVNAYDLPGDPVRIWRKEKRCERRKVISDPQNAVGHEIRLSRMRTFRLPEYRPRAAYE